MTCLSSPAPSAARRIRLARIVGCRRPPARPQKTGSSAAAPRLPRSWLSSRASCAGSGWRRGRPPLPARTSNDGRDPSSSRSTQSSASSQRSGRTSARARSRRICYTYLSTPPPGESTVTSSATSPPKAKDSNPRSFGQAGLEIAARLFSAWHDFQHDGDRAHLAAQTRPLRTELKPLLERYAGKAPKYKRSRGLARNLLKVWPALCTFTETDGVEPTNNRAERGLRGAVIHRKLSLGSQPAHGERTIERLLSASLTCRLQQRSLFAYLTTVLTADIRGDPIPRLPTPPGALLFFLAFFPLYLGCLLRHCVKGPLPPQY